MKAAVVVDTNVAIVANAKTAQADTTCVGASITKLREIRSQRRVLLDDAGRILDEYRRNLSPRGQPGLGDAFFKWLWDNQANAQVCRQVAITPVGSDDEMFVEFPDDPELGSFDRADRKFVATVLASGEHAPIVNATDTDWWHFREVLAKYGIEVVFLCPMLMSGKKRV